MCGMGDHSIYSTRQTGATEKQGLGVWCKIFVMGYVKFMMRVVSRIQMLFLGVAKGVSQWHQIWTEAVAGSTIATVSPATEI